MASGYVLAGFETLLSIIDRFIKSDRYNNQFTRNDVNKFFFNTCNNFLHSFGSNFKGRKKLHNYARKESEVFKKCRDFGLSNDSLFWVDSGGFQISVGMLNAQESANLYDIYYKFLVDYYDVYDKAFVLDIPPGPGCVLFDNFEQVEEMNTRSYLNAASMPDNVRSKLIYIHHFRTPKLWEIYHKILRENDLFSKFQYHGTGGIAANQGSDMSIPCIIYVLPLIPLINEALKCKRTFLNFHILGGATHRDILFYELFRILVKEKHNIDLNITYDSSTMFKGFMIGRHLTTIDGDYIRKTDLRSCKLNQRYYSSEKTIIEKYSDSLDIFANKYGFKSLNLNKDTIYDIKTGTFFEEVKLYSMLYMLSMYSEVEHIMIEKAKPLYELYKAGEIEEFSEIIGTITRNINSGKITQKTKSKSFSISKSLDMLINLDEDYCKYIVNKYLAKDEFIELTNERILKF